MPTDSSRLGTESLTVAITGASGMIGSALVRHLEAAGYSVRKITRRREGAGPRDIVWNPQADELDPTELAGVDAIVHLAGESLSQRWTDDHKRAIRDSRVRGTSLVATAVLAMATPPRVAVSASAIGVYGNRGDEVLDERSESGTDFLASVCRDWEASAAPMATGATRLVLLRSGVVLSEEGGALQKMLPPFRLGAGGPLGSGHQWLSWIALHDHIRAIEFAIRNTSVSGAINLTSPNPVTNAVFAETLGDVLHRPAIISVPAFALELMFGEMARATILASQRVRPRMLTDAGFVYDYPQLEQALGFILDPGTAERH